MPLQLVVLLLSAAPGQDYALLPVATVGLPAERSQLYGEHLSVRLTEQGIAVTSPVDAARVLGVERQKQLLGCEQESACIAEIAGALGAKALISVQVSRVESGFHVVLKVLDASTASARLARTRRVPSEDALLEALDDWAREIAGRPRARRSWLPWLPMGAGVAAVGVGAGFFVSAGSAYGALGQRGDAALSHADAVATRQAGERDQVTGAVFAGAGALVFSAGLLWYLLTSPDDSRSTWLVPTPNGLALVGVWP